MLLYLLTFKWHSNPLFNWIPARRVRRRWRRDPAGWATHLFLPWIVLAVVSIGFYARVVRNSLLETQHQDYIRTARSKGLPNGGC